ncbi:hypothetical protein [Actinomadura kijaniata]|uniref:hypothetical protein n=1 Tax=Actinomadura kijaniata TaxID=46161 RepID=UPI0012FCB0AC|nr:hypothetical protein [Actinomadura kijaniata]
MRQTRTARFAALLPTNLPGVRFTASGRIWFRRVTDGPGRDAPTAVARAAALAAVHDLASGISGQRAPAAVFDAEQQIALRLGGWQASEEHHVKFKGKLRLSLAPADMVKAERFDEARRLARLEEAVTHDRLGFLRDVTLADPRSAQLWWLQRNLEGEQPETSWQVFDEMVRPLIVNAASQDDAVTRFANLVVSLVDRVHEDSDRLEILAGLSKALLETMGWQDLADEAAALFAVPPPVPE